MTQLTMKGFGLIKCIFIVIIAFIYLFPVHLTILPGFLNTRIILACFGVIFLCSKRNIHYKQCCLSGMSAYYTSIWTLFIIAFLTSLINGIFEKQFLLYPISLVITILSCIGLIRIANNTFRKHLSSVHLIDLFTGIIVLECGLSLLAFYFPSFNSIFYSLVELDGLEAEATMSVIGSINQNRLAGVGISFFGAGIAFSVSLFLICVRFTTYLSLAGKILYVLSFILICFVGSAISRTSQVGGIVGIVYFLFFQFRKNRQRFFSLKSISIVLLILLLFNIILVLYQKYIDSNEIIENIFRHAFEAFYRFFEEGRFYTTSSDKSLDSYIWPKELSTWLIGDGRLIGTQTFSYYKETDIGWCRLVFYFGIIGTAVFMLSQFMLIMMMCLPKIVRYSFFLLLCLFLSKGIADLMSYAMPFVLIGRITTEIKKR